jgi:hypothetical protein
MSDEQRAEIQRQIDEISAMIKWWDDLAIKSLGQGISCEILLQAQKLETLRAELKSWLG